MCLPFPKSATGHYPLHAVTLENLQQSSFRRWCHNSTACSIPSNDIRTLPELHGNAYAKLDTSSLYLPHRYHPYWRFTKYHNRKFFSKGGKKARQYQGTTGNPSTVLCLGHAISTTANITTRTSAILASDHYHSIFSPRYAPDPLLLSTFQVPSPMPT